MARSAPRRSGLRFGGSVAMFALIGSMICGCNYVIGTEDHDAYPENCGAETLTTARFSFSDDRNGHCYSLVLTEDEENGSDFNTAKDSCAEAGGQLACVNDAVELELIGRNVPTQAWLGMNALRVSGVQSFECLSGDKFDPDYAAWEEGHPSIDEGGSCTILSDGRVRSRGCWGGVSNWLCELAPTSDN